VARPVLRFSRRRAVMVFAVAVIAACKPQPAASSPQPKVSVVPDPANTFDGTCAALANWREKVGVYDDDGIAHPKYAAWTIATFSHSNFSTATPAAQSIQLVKCNCNGKVYDDVQVCLAECKVSLGCFTGICAPAGSEVCLNVPGVMVNFGAKTRTSRLDWKQPTGSSQRCQDERTRWIADAEAHEAHHVADAQNLALGWGQRWLNRPYRACGATEAEARMKLQSQIQTDLDAEVRTGGALPATFDQLSEQFDATNVITDPNCAACP
jgi:hypothetical protein